MHESIYNLTPKVFQPPEKPIRYTSKFTGTVREELCLNKDSKRTMGPAQVVTKDPQDFLRKRDTMQEANKTRPPRQFSLMPGIPNQTDKPVLNLKTLKDFIKLNAVSNMMAIARQPGKLFVDAKNGDRHDHKASGLEPVYILKKEYGSVPSYLEIQKNNLKKIEAEVDCYIQEKRKVEALKEISKEEREALIQGLKMNWEELHMEYQRLPIFVDTVPKRNRKQTMEKEMKKLEGFISLIEQYSKIFLAK